MVKIASRLQKVFPIESHVKLNLKVTQNAEVMKSVKKQRSRCD